MLFGILYPGYMSYKVLKTKRSTNYVCLIVFIIIVKYVVKNVLLNLSLYKIHFENNNCF